MNPRLQQVIIVEERRGEGTATSPVRMVKQVFDTEGNLIAENDPMAFELLKAEWHRESVSLQVALENATL